jgi:DNA-binding response OmpR family regulator
MVKVLILEDDASLLEGLEYSFKKHNFNTSTTKNVRDAIDLISKNKYDLLLLDVTLTDGSGFEVCDFARNQEIYIPIIFLTASDEEVNVIRGLDIGADDYITKPFRLSELFSRINALLRRYNLYKKFDELGKTTEEQSIESQRMQKQNKEVKSIERQNIEKQRIQSKNIVDENIENQNLQSKDIERKNSQSQNDFLQINNFTSKITEHILKSGNISIDLENCCVFIDRTKINLTISEYKLLTYFIINKCKLLSREKILDELWDDKGSFVDNNTLSVYVRRLREKIEENPSEPKHLLTIRGFGYQWMEE